MLNNTTQLTKLIINLITVKEAVFQKFGVSKYFLMLDFRTNYQLPVTFLTSVIAS